MRCFFHPSIALALLALPGVVGAAELRAKVTTGDLSKPDPKAAYWQQATPSEVTLTAQPMQVPRPKTTTTSTVQVQSLHNGQWIAFRLRWKDPDRNEAGRLGEFSDAVAVQFPVKAGDATPVFMGTVNLPVHIFHWRAQYQRDATKGKPQMKDLYPNMSVDIYPLEFNDPGRLGKLAETDREKFSPGVAEGNPQSFQKTGVDEIYAEGFSTSSVQSGDGAAAQGVWENGEWTVVITRKLIREGASELAPGKKTFAGFAVWQGGLSEVGARKCVTMAWTPVELEAAGAKP